MIIYSFQKKLTAFLLFLFLPTLFLYSCSGKYQAVKKSMKYIESGDLKAQVEAYKELTGYYPKSVHVDKIYRTK